MKVSELNEKQKERFVNFIADYLSIDSHEADKVLALMIYLDDEIQDLRSIKITPYGFIKSYNKEYLVLTDSEADIASKNNAEKGLVCTASSAGGRGRFTHFLPKWFAHCSVFAAKWNFPIFQTERASDRRRRGWRFCWSGGGSALQGNAQKQVFVFRFFQCRKRH